MVSHLLILFKHEEQWNTNEAALSMLTRQLGDYLRFFGDYQQARKFLELSVFLREEIHGVDHIETGKGFDRLATVLQNLGEFKEAEQLFRRALEIAEKQLGVKHTTTGIRLNNL
ncbi:tetratricopeptide repeat protein, partial [Magnetococcales bacterium HHB-1]